MNLRMYVLATAVSACALFTVNQAPAATVVVSDTFTNTTLHPTFKSITGQNAEVTSAGVGTWVSGTTGAAAGSGSHGWLTGAADGIHGLSYDSPAADIAIPSPTVATTVQADVFPANYNTWNAGGGYWQGWVAIGFQAAPSGVINDWYGANNRLWALASYNGGGANSYIQVYKSGNSTVVATVSGLTFNPTETIGLSYDPVGGTYELFRSGVSIASGPVTLGGTIASAGFLGNGADNDSGGSLALKNFVVSVVPEPTSLGLVSLGAMAMLRRRRHA